MANKIALPDEREQEFKEDMEKMSIRALARKYDLSEKTAHNTRKRFRDAAKLKETA